MLCRNPVVPLLSLPSLPRRRLHRPPQRPLLWLVSLCRCSVTTLAAKPAEEEPTEDADDAEVVAATEGTSTAGFVHRAAGATPREAEALSASEGSETPNEEGSLSRNPSQQA